MTKKLLLAAAAAVLGLTLWWMFTESTPDLDELGSSKAEAELLENAEEAAPEVASEEATGDDAADSSDPTRKELEDVGGGRTLTFRVVRGEELQPVEGAEDFFLQAGDVDQEKAMEMGMDRMDPHFMFKEFGLKAVTDVDGLCQLPWKGKEGAAFAEFSDLQSDMELTDSATEGVITLKMVAATGVTVQVVDAAGKAVIGAPVSLRVLTEDGSLGDDMEMTMFTRPTLAPNGEIKFQDVSGLMSFDHDPDPDFQVRLEIPGSLAVKEPVKISESHQQVTLVMPPVGQLNLEIIDPAGARVVADGVVELSASGASGRSSTSFIREDVAIRLDGTIQKGLVSFPFIGQTNKLRARIRIPEMGLDWQQNLEELPQSGQVAEVQIVAPTAPVVRGRFFTPDGKPAVRRRGLITLQDLEGRFKENWSFRTDGEGRFLHQISEHYLGKEYRLFLTCHGGLGRSYVRAIDEPQLLADKDLDLGDIHLETAYRKISGRCVNPDGVGVGGFLLHAQRADGIRTAVNVKEDGSFQFDSTFRRKTKLTRDSYQQSDWVLPEPVEVEADGEEVELIFFPAGSIVGRVEIPEEMANQEFFVYAKLLPQPGAPADPPGVYTRRSFDGEVTRVTGAFTIKGLDRGNYDIELKGNRSNQLALVKGVQVNYGMPASDPRLNPLRFHDNIHRVNLKLVDASGKSALNGRATFYRNGVYIGSSHDAYGKVECAYPSPGEVQVLLEAEGYRPQWLEGSVTDQSITMQAGLKIILRCTAMPDVNQGNKSIELMLKWQPENPRMKKLDAVTLPNEFLRTGSSVVELPGPGIYQLLYREVSSGDGFSSFSDEQPVPGADPISVSEQDHGKTYPLPVPETLFN